MSTNKDNYQELLDFQKYNGWTNYETWRVKLENFDGYSFVREDVWGKTISDFAEQLKGDVETRLDEEFDNETRDTSLANQYAHAFIEKVNWYEIAASINTDCELGLK